MLKKISLTALLSLTVVTAANADKVKLATDGSGDFFNCTIIYCKSRYM